MNFFRLKGNYTEKSRESHTKNFIKLLIQLIFEVKEIHTKILSRNDIDLAMNDKATNNNFSPKILRSNQKVRQKY